MAVRAAPSDIRPQPAVILAALVAPLLLVLSLTNAAGAASWTSGSGPEGFNALACLSSSYCLSLGGGIDALTYNGSSWSSTNLNPFGFPGQSVSCVSTTSEFCLAIQTWGGTYVYNGTTWSDGPALPSTGDPSYSVSCVSSTFCLAIGETGTATGEFYEFDGTTWSAMSATVGNYGTADSIACLSTTFCAAVYDHDAYTYDGTAWSNGSAIPAGGPDRSAALSSVSCVSPTFCLLTDTSGDTYAYNGTKWSSAGDAVANSSASADQLSCATTTFCLAVGKGYAWEFNGAEWSAPGNLDQGNSGDLQNVDCTSTSFCMLTASNDDYYTYTSGLVGLYPPRATITVSNKRPTSGKGSITLNLRLAGTPTPTGSVEVKLGRAKLCQGPLGAGAYACRVPISKLKVGTNKLVLTYPGNGYWGPLSATVSIAVKS